MIPLPTRSTLFPYTTLFRSDALFEQQVLLSKLAVQILGFEQVVDAQQDFDRIERLAEEILGAARERALLRLRSEEHTSELQSQFHIVCRLLLEKKKTQQNKS